jgi:hypothetical protein
MVQGEKMTDAKNGNKPALSPELDAVLVRLGSAIADKTEAQERTEVATQKAKKGEVIQFPLFPEERRPVSNDVARSALFSCVQGKDREMVENALIATVDGVEIRFTGRRFNQDDHDVLMQLIHIAAHKPLGEWVTVPAYALLKALGRKTGNSQHVQLCADITRLISGTVSLKSKNARIEYIGHFVEKALQDEESRYWKFQLNPDLRYLYDSANHTLIDWEQRKGLRGKDLARWLQLYIATHAAPFPVKVATLQALSGSQMAELYNFRAGLRKALQDLTNNSDIGAWSIDPVNDLVSVTRGGAITGSQRRYLAKARPSKKARH